MLYDMNIIADKNSEIEKIFLSLTPNFFKVQCACPSAYVRYLWELYQKQNITDLRIGNDIFKVILSTLFVKEGLLPLFLNSHICVPYITHDLVLYSSETGPICLSAKTSLRERYKQADLEAIALKYVHRKSKSYLITLGVDEAKSVKEKIKEGSVIGLDAVFVATEPEFDELIENIKSYTLSESPTIKVVHANQMVTEAKIKACFK